MFNLGVQGFKDDDYSIIIIKYLNSPSQKLISTQRSYLVKLDDNESPLNLYEKCV